MNIDQLMQLWKEQFQIKNIDEIKSKILIYKDFLQSENKKYNLTRLDKEEIIYREYFYHSVINFNYEMLSKPNLNLLDIGSGSGIPGVILKILFDDINLYIVESSTKKCVFLKELCNKLSLKNVYIVNERCEEYIKNKRSFFDFITCRAVAEIRIILELSIPGLKQNGVCYCLKSNNYLNELDNSKKIMNLLNLKEPNIYTINDENKTFVGLTFIKEKENDLKYPRSWKEILDNDKN